MPDLAKPEKTINGRTQNKGMGEFNMENLLKKVKANVVVSSFLCVVLGIVLVIWPGLSMQIVCIAVGVVLVLGGAIRLAGFFTNRDGSMYSQLNLITGIIFIAVGVWIIFKPENVLKIIPIIVGIVIVVHGINNLQQAVELCKGQYDKWWIALILGILTIGFGVLLICRPFAALDTVVMMIGIFLIYDGLSNIWIVSRIAKSVKILKQEAEAIDVEVEK